MHADTRSGRPQHSPVGWEPDNDGFRGYIFATDDNSTVVLSIKGTSAQWVDKGPTTERDKLNDNLLFSCCCARINWSWTTVCDCYRGGWKCNQDCLEDALVEESLFYSIGTVCFYHFSELFGVDVHFGGFRTFIITSPLCSPTQTYGSLGILLAAHSHLFSELRLVYRS